MAEKVLTVLNDTWAVLDLGVQWALALRVEGKHPRWSCRRYHLYRDTLERDIYELVYETEHEYAETGRTWEYRDKAGFRAAKPVLRVTKFYTAPEETQRAVRELMAQLPERYV